jgi:ATP-dependent exoDNAse (exonuclease V) beta subunit
MNAATGHVVIRASAGTGKTYQLTNRFLKLLLEGEPPQRILATTFTRKAAGEIFDRVLLRLAQAATSDQERRRLAQALELAKLPRQRCLELLTALVRDSHLLRIGTLDSFFVQIAGSFALELGLPLGWRIAEPLEDQALREEAVAAVLEGGNSQDLLALFHLLTKGEVHRSVMNLVLGVVAEMYDLFRETEESAWKQFQRHRGLPPEKLAAAIDALRHAPIPSGKQWEDGRAGDVAAAESGNWKRFLEKGIANKVLCQEPTYCRKPIPPAVVAAYVPLIQHARSVLVTQVAQQTEATWQLLAHFAAKYEQLKEQRRLLRFDDITWHLARHLTADTLQRLDFRLDSGIWHLLLDEFQDTSLAQWRVLLPLAQQVTQAGRGRQRRSFFCVGDVKQAIYGWRGGLAEIFDALDESLKGLKPSILAKSYRSSPVVIDTVNRVFTGMTKHDNLDKLEEPVRLWQQSFPEHTTAREDLPGYVTLEASPAAGEEQDADEVHYAFAADRVAELARQAPGRSIGVLARTNDVVARMIYLLRQRNVAASEEGGNPLVDSPAVEVILSLLRIADHPGDTVARFHVATSPLGPKIDYGDHRNSWAAARLSHELRRRLIEEGYGAVVLDYGGRLAADCDERDRSRLAQLVELAYQYQTQATLRADDFARLVENTRIADPSAAAVRVMTIHQAKGLEFDIVVLPELRPLLAGQPRSFVVGRPKRAANVEVVCRYCDEQTRKLLPEKMQALFEAATRQEAHESLCLLYVALTRAVHALHMIVPPKENERTLPKTWAGLLRAALTDGRPLSAGQFAYEHGDPHWHKHAPPAAPPAEGPPPLAASLTLAPASGLRRRGLERASPSGLEGGTHIALSSILAPRDDRGLDFGTLIHAWLEEIDWLDDSTPNESRLRSIAARLRPEIGELAVNLDGPLAAFAKMLRRETVRQVLSRAYYRDPAALGLAGKAARQWPNEKLELEVLREHPFAIRQGDQLLSGAIDRLVLIRARGTLLAADVVDYKTDAIPESDAAALADRIEYYRPQLAAYCRAVQSQFRLRAQCVTSRLVFVSAGKVGRLGPDGTAMP